MRDPDQSIGFLVNDIARLLRRDFNRRAQALGLSQSQWRALFHLARQQGVNQVTLADSMDIQPMTLARLIDGLEKQGLVARRPDPADRRAVQLYLTEAAEPVMARLRVLADETRAEALAGIPDAALQQLFEMLSRIKQQLVEAELRTDAEASKKPQSGARDDG